MQIQGLPAPDIPGFIPYLLLSTVNSHSGNRVKCQVLAVGEVSEAAFSSCGIMVWGSGSPTVGSSPSALSFCSYL